MRIDQGQIIDWRWRAGKRAEKAGGVKAKSFDVDAGQYKAVFDVETGQYKAAGGEPDEVGGIIAFEESAQRAAQTRQKKGTGGKGETENLELTLVGRPNLRAGSLVEPLSRWPELQGTWEAEQVMHSISRSGYTSQAHLKRKD